MYTLDMNPFTMRTLYFILVVLVTGATAQCPNYATDPPECYACPDRYEPEFCLSCNTASEYVGVAPDCIPCVAADPTETGYCSRAGTRVGQYESSTTCTCTCRNGYRGTKCDTCPEHFELGPELTCGSCSTGYFPYPSGVITSTTICSLLCTTANCSFAGTPASGDTYAAGCLTCLCGSNRDPATRCATCFTGFDLSNNCQTCLTGYDTEDGNKCYKKCTILDNCTVGNTASVGGNEKSGCVCGCNALWTGKTCQTCAPLMNPTCTACIAGYESAGNCTKTCTVADCANHATEAFGNYRTGCQCRCQDYWYGVSLGGGLTKNCTSCPPNFNANCDQCIAGYQLNSGVCKELCTNADCNNRSTQVSGLKGNCSCECSNAWAKPYCATCPARFAGSDCNECNVGYVEFPTCIKNCTNEVDCNFHASTVQGFTNGTCSCTCRNGWTGANCETCPYRYDRDNDCTGCNSTTHEGVGLQCYPKCTVPRNCSNHAYNVSGNDNTTCLCWCQNEWTNYTCNTCPAKYNSTKNCGECSALYEKYPDCYLKCTNVANCTGRATNVTGNVNDGCNCFCNASTKWTGPKCDICPSIFLQTTCSSCAANYTKYPNCYLLCSNANCSNNADSWTGDTSTGCNCTCKDKWQGAQCNICPAGGNLTDNCRTCNAGFGGPLCEQLCTSANDCNGHASNVTGYVGNCTCKCATNWYGAKCDQCPVRYNASLNCLNCSAGYVQSPQCFLNCTIAANCSSHATEVSGNSNTSCKCSCRNQWSGGNCSTCKVNYDPTQDCGDCAPTYNFYPTCSRDCTNVLDCNNRSTLTSGVFPNCSCTCRNEWTGSDCGTCPAAFDAANDCYGCAEGYRGSFPNCLFICTALTNCSSHATGVVGDTGSGCNCSCANKWVGDDCSVCPSRYTPTYNCSTCALNYINYPTCTYVCNTTLDCSGHATNVSGFEWDCNCTCRNKWSSANCSVCPANYNMTQDCGNCSKGYDSYPGCYLTCTNINNCSNHSTAVSGNTNTGCNCTCRNKWFGPYCNQCPPLYDSTKDCNICIPGWSGFPNCQELCTNATDCTNRATAVSGYKGNCTCACRNSYNGSSCGTCASIYDLAKDCSQCADGYDPYPLCPLTCTLERDCSGQATNVAGNYATGCVCTCRNKWTSANCSVCDSNYESRDDCKVCADGYDNYPYCDRICTIWDDCSGHATEAHNLYPNCTCSCAEQWVGKDCSVCPQQYDALNNCASCAVGYTGVYPVCSYICTIASNCSSHATAVSGTTLTGCNCSCRSMWNHSDCGYCEAKFDPAKDCGACAYGFESYPECRTACMVDRDCNKRASSVTGIYPNCTCACRNKWEGASCDKCPSIYNATADCAACTLDREWFPDCYRLCNFSDCTGNAVEVSGNEHTGCTCLCRNAYQGANCSYCPPTVDATKDCAQCIAGYDGYPNCGPKCTPMDCTNRSVSVSGGRPNCTCNCRNGWSGPDCSVCPLQYNVSTDCFNCSAGHTKVNGKCYRYCNVSLDCNDRGLNVTGNIGSGCNCSCRNNYTAPVCAMCPTGYNATGDCTGCAEGYGGFPVCRPLCQNVTHCSGRAVVVQGYIGACHCICRNGWWGKQCEICPSQYNLIDDCATCNKYRRQNYPNCSRLTRSMPTQTFTANIMTQTLVIPSNTTSQTLPLPLTPTASTLTQYLSGTTSMGVTCTLTTTLSRSASPSDGSPTSSLSKPSTQSRSAGKTKSRLVAPTRTNGRTRTFSLPNCKVSTHCVHANATYRVGYNCVCVCYGNWTGQRCDQCPERYYTYLDSNRVVQGCSACAAGFVLRNGSCLTSSHFYGSLDAGNSSCDGATVSTRYQPAGVGSRLVLLEKLSYDLYQVLIGVYVYLKCPNYALMQDSKVFTATIFEMYPTSSAVPARDLRYLFDAVMWNESKVVALSMSECMSLGMQWLLDVWKNGGEVPTTSTRAPTTTLDPRNTTTAPTTTRRPTFAPQRRNFAVANADNDTLSNETELETMSNQSATSTGVDNMTYPTNSTTTNGSAADNQTESETPPITTNSTQGGSTNETSGVVNVTSSAEGLTNATEPSPTGDNETSSATYITTTTVLATTSTTTTTRTTSTASSTEPHSTTTGMPTTTATPIAPLLFLTTDTMFPTRNASDYLGQLLGVNGTGCLAFQGAAFGYGDYSRCGLIGCAPEDFDPLPAKEKDPFPWWWIILGVVLLALLIIAVIIIRRYRLNRRIDEVVNPKDTHKYTLQFLLNEDEDLRALAQDREEEEMNFFDDDDLL